ncbi:hypothetical protein [Roseibium polysiphoniae]|uniref:hypothetical protein n=1 Tax=Roseibium polysiphoniae TaxID=2571221 RepID=UPI001BCD9D01|nr:hypothetical protein [Roseibium polysiphoniae]
MDRGPGILEESFECFKKMRLQIKRLHERLVSNFEQNRVEQVTAQTAQLRHKIQTDYSKNAGTDHGATIMRRG